MSQSEGSSSPPNLLREKKRLQNEIVLKMVAIEKSKSILKSVNVDDLPDKGERIKNTFIAKKHELKALERQLASVHQMLAEVESSPEIALPKTKFKPKARILDSSSSSVESDKENYRKNKLSATSVASNSKNNRSASISSISSVDSPTASSTLIGNKTPSPVISVANKSSASNSSFSSVISPAASNTSEGSKTTSPVPGNRINGQSESRNQYRDVSSVSEESSRSASPESAISSPQFTSDESSDSVIAISDSDEGGSKPVPKPQSSSTISNLGSKPVPKPQSSSTISNLDFKPVPKPQSSSTISKDPLLQSFSSFRLTEPIKKVDHNVPVFKEPHKSSSLGSSSQSLNEPKKLDLKFHSASSSKGSTELADDYSWNASSQILYEDKKSGLQTFLKPQSKVKERPIWEAKLPSSQFNLNEMGKKALETHRVQQSLTMDSLRTIHKSLETMPCETELMSDPKMLKKDVELMPHQKHALAWLLWREKQKPRGGILADDMGLGKTLTMISLVLKNRELQDEGQDNSESNESSDGDDSEPSSSRPKKYPGGTLVIAPASLLSQWEGEVRKRVKSETLKVLVHHGGKREERARRLSKYDMVVTTYGIVQSDAKSVDSSPIFGVAWERIIIDEAHQIRNPKTHSSLAVCRLTAKYRWALTGTPIHNKQLDMYGLLKFLKCKPFDDLTVWKRWVDNRDAAGTKRLNTVVKSVMLRRTKEQLLTKGTAKLPPKVFKKIDLVLDEDEKEVYHKLLLLSSTLFAQYLSQRAEKEELNTYGVVINRKKNLDHLKNEEAFKNHPELAALFQKMTQAQEIKAHQVLVFILRLRQMCCHPSLISAMIDQEAISADGIEEDGIDLDFMDRFKRMSIKPDDVPKTEEDGINGSQKLLSSDHPLFSRDRVSSKVRKVIEVLEKEILPSNDKVVIVSQWTGFLAILEEFLRKHNIRCDSLTGAIPIPERGPIVEKFNEPSSRSKVLLLSLTAGGCGLNLVGGNHLMLIDIHWNPQLENQACDRIYRVGQKKDVFIYRFVTSDTIEEGIEQIQSKKLALADQVLTGAKKIKASQLTLDDMKILFGMGGL